MMLNNLHRLWCVIKSSSGVIFLKLTIVEFVRAFSTNKSNGTTLNDFPKNEIKEISDKFAFSFYKKKKE